MVQKYVTRFAPSPTGNLHLGHAFAALFAYRAALESGGQFILRIEDIDQGRCRPTFEKTIREDLEWLGIVWEDPVRRQSEHLEDYSAVVKTLIEEDLLYPCFCTRAEIRGEIARAGIAPHSPASGRYPGKCRQLDPALREERLASGWAHAWRINMERARKSCGPLQWWDKSAGIVVARPERFGDVVLARKDMSTSYHLAVTMDDAAQGVTLVTRGEDLFSSTDVHRLLQALIGIEVPEYAHHRILKNASGRRFSKRDNAMSLRTLRQCGRSADEVVDALTATCPLDQLSLSNGV